MLLLVHISELTPSCPQPAVVTLLGFGFVGLWATAGILKARPSSP